MLGLQCLECRHDNPIGAQFCSRCDSRLNLKLCLRCEAINEAAWERCHECGTEFRAQSKTELPKTELPHAALPAARPARADTRRRLVIACLTAAVAGSAYYLHREPGLAPKTMDSVKSQPAPSVAATVVETKPAPPAVVSPPAEQVPAVAAPALALWLDAKPSSAAPDGAAAPELAAPAPAAAARRVSRSQRPAPSISRTPVVEESSASVVTKSVSGAREQSAEETKRVAAPIAAPQDPAPAAVATALVAAPHAASSLKQAPASQPPSTPSTVSVAAAAPSPTSQPPRTSALADKEGDYATIPGVTEAGANRILEGIASRLASLQYAATVGSLIEQLLKSDAAASSPAGGTTRRD